MIAAKLVGTCRPVAVINTRPDGSTVYLLGADPRGILVFESNGRFAFILTFCDDEMRWTDPTPSIGGTIENVWTRTK